MSGTNDITAVYYTAGHLPKQFQAHMMGQLKHSLAGIPMEIVRLGDESERSHFMIYRQALAGAKKATTPYIALCEDDVLYSPEHFKYRPSPGKFAYNLGAWSIFTWGKPVFTHKGIVRRNLNGLICERELFIEAMEERFAKYPKPTDDLKKIWAEPGRYENQLGVTVRETEEFYTNPPNIVFSHQTELSFAGLGTRKRVGEFRAYEIPYWGTAEKIRGLYE